MEDYSPSLLFAMYYFYYYFLQYSFLVIWIPSSTSPSSFPFLLQSQISSHVITIIQPSATVTSHKSMLMLFLCHGIVGIGSGRNWYPNVKVYLTVQLGVFQKQRYILQHILISRYATFHYKVHLREYIYIYIYMCIYTSVCFVFSMNVALC